MRLFDWHCDTPLSLYEKGMGLDENSLHVDLHKSHPYSVYIQVGAVWAPKAMDDETAWENWRKAQIAFAETVQAHPAATLVSDAAGIRDAAFTGQRAFLPAVEDARILCGDLTRLDILRQCGVRILTLQWAGETIIGGGFDTDAPLTEFGRRVVERCFALGIVPDVSHASRAVTAEVIALARAAGKPIIASHSCAYGCFAHPRNLTDEEFGSIVSLGGVVGLSLVPYHLTDMEKHACTLDTVAEHIRHYLALGGERALCLGCDLDGVSRLPEGIRDLTDVRNIADHLRESGMTEEQIDRIFFRNAYEFALRHL